MSYSPPAPSYINTTVHLFQPALLHHYSLNAHQYAVLSYLQWCCITGLVFRSSVLLSSHGTADFSHSHTYKCTLACTCARTEPVWCLWMVLWAVENQIQICFMTHVVARYAGIRSSRIRLAKIFCYEHSVAAFSSNVKRVALKIAVCQKECNLFCLSLYSHQLYPVCYVDCFM